MLKTDASKTGRPTQNPTGSPVALPSCAEFSDQKVIESAISHIRTLLAKTVMRGMDEIGRYLLRHFYNDDPKLYFSAIPKKHMSLRQLMERCESMELPVRRTFLANALRMAAISKTLRPTAKFHELPSSHRQQLLRLKDPEIIELIASEAVSQKLSVLKVRDLVDKQLEKGGNASGRGRRRTPPAALAIDSCLQRLQDEETGKLLVSRSDIRDMSGLERTHVKARIVALQRCLKELRRLIR